MDPIRVIEYGEGPGPVFALHGGPGAPGSAGPLARALASHFHVFEPWQRESGDGRLDVSRHIEDLKEAIDRCAESRPVALVGESWGAMLALAFAARHSQHVRAIALVGCGTFDLQTRVRLGQVLQERTTPELEAALRELEASEPDPARRFAREHQLRDPLYTYDRDATAEDGIGQVDFKGHHESWSDMVRLQEEGAYPAAFSAIPCPVLMLHGSYDPHPGALTRDVLSPHLPQLDYREFARCGHDPLVERQARAEYLETLGGWLATQFERRHEAD